MSTQTRWVLLQVEVSDEKMKATEEEVQRNFDSVDELIELEVQWLNNSFDSVSILWIADSYEPDVQVEE